MDKFPTTLDLMSRISWDTKFNPYNCIVCYKDRFLKYKEIPFPKWKTEGADIPIHRIYQFKYNDKIFWDRNTKYFCMDLVKDSEIDIFPSLKMHKYDKKDKLWILVNPNDTSSNNSQNISDPFTILSWNVLFDKFDEDKTRFDIRIGSVSQLLNTINPDIICFQEITSKIKQQLLKIKHIQNYYVTDVDNRYNDLLIISKFPFVHIRTYKLNRFKHILRCTLKFKDEYFDIYNIHLTSDMSNNFEEKRLHQLEIIKEFMSTTKTNILVGDTNIENNHLPHCDDLLDCWVSMHGLEEGNTYCPEENEWANMFSKKKYSRRYDRILYKTIGDIFCVESISVIKDKFENIHPSDHFPLLASFGSNDNMHKNCVKAMEYSNNTAVTIIPPYNICQEIDKIRKIYDNKYNRWMPHLNIIYGFVPLSDIYLRKTDIQRVVDKYLPLLMEFSGLGTFDQGQSCVVYLEPTPACKKILIDIQKNLFGNIFETEMKYEPHLKIGYLRQKSDLSHFKNIKCDYKWMIEHISVIYKSTDSAWDLDRFRQKYTCNIQNISNTYSTDFLVEMLNTIPNMKFTVVGSVSINLDTSDSDLDVIIYGDIKWDDALKLLIKWSQNIYDIKSIKSISNKWINKAKLTMINLQEIELIHMNSHSIENVIYNKLDLQSVNAYSQYLDNVFIKDILDKNNEYILMLRYTKNWAKTKRIYGHIFGFPCGISWVILALNIIIKSKPENVQIFKKKFAKFYSNYDFSVPIQLTATKFTKKKISDELLCIIKPSSSENTMRNATVSTVNIFKTELRHFLNNSDRLPVNTVRKTLRIIYDDIDVIREVIGLINSKIYTIIIKLEEAGITVDPNNHWDISGSDVSWTVFLSADSTIWKSIIETLYLHIKEKIDVRDCFYLI